MVQQYGVMTFARAVRFDKHEGQAATHHQA